MWIKCKKGVWLVNHEKKTIISPPCGLKSCPSCSKKRKKVIVLRILSLMDKMQYSHKFWFLTITPHSKAIWARQSEKNLRDGWSKMRKRINRLLKGQIFWVMTREYTKGSGEFTDAPEFVHGHIIIGYPTTNDSILTEALKDIATACGMGWAVHVGTKQDKDLPIKSVREAWYIAKYAVKIDLEGRLQRTIAWSRNFPELGDSPQKAEGWEFLNQTDDSVKRYANLLRYDIKVLRDDD